MSALRFLRFMYYNLTVFCIVFVWLGGSTLTSQDYSPSSVVCVPKLIRAIWRYLHLFRCNWFLWHCFHARNLSKIWLASWEIWRHQHFSLKLHDWPLGIQKLADIQQTLYRFKKVSDLYSDAGSEKILLNVSLSLFCNNISWALPESKERLLLFQV